MCALHARDAAPDAGAVNAALIGKQDDWEALGLEKRTDYENLRRVFERICGAKRTHFDAKDLAHAFKWVAQSALFAGELRLGAAPPGCRPARLSGRHGSHQSECSEHALQLCVFRVNCLRSAIESAWRARTCSIVGYAHAKKTEYNMNEAEDIIWEHDEDLNVSTHAAAGTSGSGGSWQQVDRYRDAGKARRRKGISSPCRGKRWGLLTSEFATLLVCRNT